MMSPTSQPAGRVVVRDPGDGRSANVDTAGMERIFFDFSESESSFELTDDTLEISFAAGGTVHLLHFGRDGAAQTVELEDGTCVACAEILRVLSITDEDLAPQRG